MRRAIFPGTFDPFTIGLLFGREESRCTLVDEVVIGIGINEE